MILASAGDTSGQRGISSAQSLPVSVLFEKSYPGILVVQPGQDDRKLQLPTNFFPALLITASPLAAATCRSCSLIHAAIAVRGRRSASTCTKRDGGFLQSDGWFSLNTNAAIDFYAGRAFPSGFDH